MKQFLAVIRGAPASGKTTIARKMRDIEKKVVWLKVDNFKPFFAEETTPEQQQYVDESALATLIYLLDSGFSVVMEKIFLNPGIIPRAVGEAKKRGINGVVFQIKCPLTVLQERDRNREGVREGMRKPLGDDVISYLYEKLEETFYPGAIVLDTEKMTVEECIGKISESVL